MALEGLTQGINKIASSYERERYSSGILIGRSVNETIRESMQTPPPDPLWLSLWYEGEVSCLFSDSNLGKSLYAIQIADTISYKKRVLYFDFELSDKQFEMRYTDDGRAYKFNDNLIRVTIDRFQPVTEELIIASIEELVIKSGARVMIVDNLTWLCMASEKADAASSLMLKLCEMKFKYNLSILMIAHTPKRSLNMPISQNDLAGSKRLFNFFDSVFAIGKSAKDENLRYIKQIKCRYGAFTYNADNVIVCSIEQENALTKFRQIGLATEREHLKELSEKDLTQEAEQVKTLLSQGKTQREVADMLGISKGKVYNLSRK